MSDATLRRMAEKYARFDDSVGPSSLVIAAEKEGIAIDRVAARRLIADVRDRPQPNGRGPQEPEPLFDVAAAGFGRFLETDPPPRRMLIPDFLPLDVVGLLAAMGGAGKSVMLFMLALSIATGLPLLDMVIGEVGGALYLAAEDDEQELHRRGRRILAHAEAARHVDRLALSSRLHVVSRIAEDNLLTAGREGEVARTALVDRLIATARQIPDLKLIALDPVSRFRGGKANAEEDTTRFVEALEVVRAETGATVLAAVHVNKASIRDGGEADQSMVRGSTALVDGVRWVASMQRLRRDAAKDYGVDPAEADRYVRLELPKSNYTAPWPGMWLRREGGGVLVPATLELQPNVRQQEKAELRYAETLDRLCVLLRDEGPMTATRIRRDYAGTSGRLAAGKDTVQSVISRALAEGEIHAAPDPAGRDGQLLRLP